MKILVLMVAAFGIGGVAFGQDDLRILDQRDRRELHPALDPTEIKGLAEGEDGFRSATPALAATDDEVTYVDADVLYRRRMAMYEQGSTFSSAVPPPRDHDQRDGGEAPPAVTPAEAPVAVDESGSASLIVIACLIGVLTGTLVFIRRA